MEKILNLIRRWRYRRLYHRLFWLYLGKTNTADEAGSEASRAFQWITGYTWAEWFNKYISPEVQSEDKVVD